MASQTSETLFLLHGIRVVEIGEHLSVPIAEMVLAEQGAEVIRVVPKGQETARPVLDAFLARGN